MRYAIVLLYTLLASAGCIAGELSGEEVIQQALLSDKAADADERHGFKYYRNSRKERPEYWSWTKPIESGQFPHPGDSKRRISYDAWYTASTYRNLCWWQMPDDKALSAKALERLAEARQYQKETQNLALGDGAFTYYADRAYHIRLVSGPLELGIYVQMSGRMYDGEHTWGGFLQNEKTLKGKCDAWEASRLTLAQDMAKNILKVWEDWANKRIGRGPGFKGYYFDVKRYWPRPEEWPKGLVGTEVPKEDGWGGAFGLRLERPDPKIKGASESYGVFASAQSLSMDEPADHPIADARKEYSELVKSNTKPMRSELTWQLEALKLPDADEATRATREAHFGDERDKTIGGSWKIFARRDNVVILGYADSRDSAARATLENFVRGILAKMAKDKPTQVAAKPASGLTLTANPTELWADGRSTSTLRLEAKDNAGKPLPAGTLFKVELASNLFGECQDRVALDANGIAEFPYLAQLPWENTVTVSNERGSASVTIKQGGLSLEQENPPQTFVWADGKDTLPLIARATAPSGKPISGLSVDLALDERMLPEAGKLDPALANAITNIKGEARFIYTPPKLAPKELRFARVLFTASGGLGEPPRLMKSPLQATVMIGTAPWGKVVATGGIPWPNAVVRCAPDIVATTDAQGIFVLPAGEEKEITHRFVSLTLPRACPGGPELLGQVTFPLKTSRTFQRKSPEGVTFAVPVGTLVIKAVAEDDVPEHQPDEKISVGIPKVESKIFGALTSPNPVALRVLARGSQMGDALATGCGDFNLRKMPVTVRTYFGREANEQTFTVCAPAEGQRVECEVIVRSWRAELAATRAQVRRLLAAAMGDAPETAALINSVADVPVRFQAGIENPIQYDPTTKTIQLQQDPSELIKNGQNRESLLHEFFHAFQDHVLKEPYNTDSHSLLTADEDQLPATKKEDLRTGHDVWRPVSNAYVAYDEGRAHFFAYVMKSFAQKATQENAGTRLRSSDPLPDWDAPTAAAQPNRFNAAGSKIEGCVTRFLLDYYGDAVTGMPAEVFTDFYRATLGFRNRHGRPPQNAEEFIRAQKEAGASAVGNRDEIDTIARRYSIWPKENTPAAR